MKTLIIILLAIGFSAMAQDQPAEVLAEPEADEQSIPDPWDALFSCKYQFAGALCTGNFSICLKGASSARDANFCWDDYVVCINEKTNGCNEKMPAEKTVDE